ncbi:hypothetical protein MNBD_ALPHA06-1341 [hydrothermal vent metagenome]|uniref:DUF192 domain-containing protein n=1 Tax=hydrothermal vent metagenome TaxID=652676 RepID=A0A3B0SXV3_9ZZZZ
MKNILIPILLILSGAACAKADVPYEIPVVNLGPLQPLQIKHGDTVITLDIEFADEPDERERGLMFRTKMADDSGMLFDFESKRVVNMWMNNTLIALDMLFLDEHGKIITISRNAKPGGQDLTLAQQNALPRISSYVPVMAVLEINAGLSRKWELKRGDIVQHPMFHNLPAASKIPEKPAESTD